MSRAAKKERQPAVLGRCGSCGRGWYRYDEATRAHICTKCGAQPPSKGGKKSMAKRKDDQAAATPANGQSADTGQQATLTVVEPSDGMRKYARKLLAARKAANELRGIQKALKENLSLLMEKAGKDVIEIDGVTFYREEKERLQVEKFSEWTPPEDMDLARDLLTAIGADPEDVTVE